MRDADALTWFNERVSEAARRAVRAKRGNEFTIEEIARLLKVDYPEFTKGAIRAAVNSKCVIRSEFERAGTGVYRLLASPETDARQLEAEPLKRSI